MFSLAVSSRGTGGVCVVDIAAEGVAVASAGSLVSISVMPGLATPAGRSVQAPAAISNNAVTTAAIQIGFG